MTFRPLLALLAAAALLPACDSGEGSEEGVEGPNVDCSAVTVPKFSEMTAWAKCTNCHSSTLTDAARAGAPVGIDFDKVESARTHAATAQDEVYKGDMPLPGSPALTEAEKQQIYNWSSCDTPN
jgi:uncharacterized membrane protein